MPRAFGENRTLRAMESYYIEDNCRMITAKLKIAPSAGEQAMGK